MTVNYVVTVSKILHPVTAYIFYGYYPVCFLPVRKSEILPLLSTVNERNIKSHPFFFHTMIPKSVCFVSRRQNKNRNVVW